MAVNERRFSMVSFGFEQLKIIHVILHMYMCIACAMYCTCICRTTFTLKDSLFICGEWITVYLCQVMYNVYASVLYAFLPLNYCIDHSFTKRHNWMHVLV